MNLLIRVFIFSMFVSSCFCGSVYARTTNSISTGRLIDWSGSSLDSTIANPSGNNINPTPTYSGNIHTEIGYKAGDGYDLQMLGLYINDGYLNLTLNGTYDFTKNQNNSGIETGDFIFTFYDSDSADTYAVALSFSFDRCDRLTGLTFYWGLDSGDFDNAGRNQGAFEVSDSYTSTYWDWSDYYPYLNDSVDNLAASSYEYLFTENGYDYSLNLAISLASLESALQSIITGSNYATMYWQMSCGNDILYTADRYPDTTTGGEVPEPATFFLLGIGLLGAGFLERRRQDQQKRS